MEMPPIEVYLEAFGDKLSTRILYYKTLLIQTDYVAAKLAEAVYLGEPVEEKYGQVLEQRRQARQKIRELTGETEPELQ